MRAQAADRGAFARLRRLVGAPPRPVLDLHGHVAQDERNPLVARGRAGQGQAALGRGEVAEDPGVPAGAPGDEDEVAAGLGRHAKRVGGAPDVPRAQHRDGHGSLHPGEQRPVGLAGVALSPGAAVDGHCRGAAGLGGKRHLDGVHALPVPAGPDLDGDGDAGGLADGAHRRLDAPRVSGQRRARPGAAHLLHRAGHVQVHQVGAARHRGARPRRQDLGLGREELHREGRLRGIAVQVGLGLGAPVDEPVGRDHLGVGEGGAELAAQEPERAVGHAGEGREEEPSGKAVGSDVHAALDGTGV
jgi:hypothetical protein